MTYLSAAEAQRGVSGSSVVLVNEVDDDFYHGVLFLGAAFCYHQSEGHKSVVGYALSAVFSV